jgi:hypothetical protein
MERSAYRWRKFRPLLRLFKRMPGCREPIGSIINPWVESTPGQGAAFYLEIPREKARE